MDHGLDWTNQHLRAWAIGVPALHIILVLSFRVLGCWPGLTRKKCRGSDIIAFEVVSGLCVVYFAVAGIAGFFNINGVIDNTDIFIHKFSLRSTYVENNIVFPMLCYQVWNVFVCITHNELRTFDGIAHHVVTICLAYFGVYPFAQYYALFYFGVGELTTIPLNVVEVFKFLPDLAKEYPSFAEFSKNAFGWSFLAIRLMWWPLVSYDLWMGCSDLIQSKKAHSNFVVGFFMFANMFLTGLQFYWGYLIIKKKLSPGKNSSKDKKI